MFSLRKKLALGIDLEETTVRLVFINNKSQVQSYTELPLPEGIFGREEISNKATLANILKEGTRKIGALDGGIITTVALPERMTAQKIVSLPKSLNEDDIWSQTALHLDVSPLHYFISSEPLRKKKGAFVPCLGFAAKTTVVNDILEAIRLIELTPRSLETRTSALCNALVLNSNFNIFVANLSDDCLTVSIVHEDAPLTLSQEVLKECDNIGEEDAYSHPYIKLFLNHLNKAIKNSKIDHLRQGILTGSLTKIAGFDLLLEEEIRVRTKMADIINTTLPPEYAVAYGLAKMGL